MKIPDDFPQYGPLASLAGVQPKVAVRKNVANGTYYQGPSTAELQERYEICEDLTVQLISKCRANRSTKYASLSESDILERLLRQLLGTGWGSPQEMRWVIRQVATALAWSVPPAAVDKK